MPLHAPVWRELLEYVNHVRRHWVALAAGTVTALIGFGTEASGRGLQPWVWWLLSVVFLGIAQYRAYRDVRHELTQAEAEKRAAAARLERLQNDDLVEGETFTPTELVKPGGLQTITDRTFRKCTITGPSIIAFLGNGMIDGCTWEGAGQSSEAMLYLAHKESPMVWHRRIHALHVRKMRLPRHRRLRWAGDT